MMSAREEFGARLRGAREGRGLSIGQIANATKISVLVLEALERGDASHLPGGLFSRAFVRAYAREVGLNAEETVSAFVDAFPDEFSAGLKDDGTRLRMGRSADESTRWHSARWAGVVVTLVLILGFFGVERYLNRSESPASPTATTRAQRVAQVPAPQPAAPPVAAARSQPASAPPSSVPEQQPGQSADNPAQGAPVHPPAGQGALNLVVTLSAPCWISARVDGQRIVARTVPAGENVELHADHAVVLTAGDAGAVTYTINNVPGRPLGDRGKVATVVITTANYQTFIAGR